MRLHHVMLRHFGEGRTGLPGINDRFHFVNASGFLLIPKHQGLGGLSLSAHFPLVLLLTILWMTY